MSDMDINLVLAQMRSMASAAGSENVRTDGQASGGVNFSELMKQALEQVNETQSTAKELATAFELGKEGVELPEVMIALQKSSISFQAVTQVRNKLLSAYQEVMSMPL